MQLRKTRLTHEEHLKFATLFHAFQDAQHALGRAISGRFPKASRLYRALLNIERTTGRLQSELDDAYHAVTTEKQFHARGHIYYDRAKAARSLAHASKMPVLFG